jgi:hypothetical protein
MDKHLKNLERLAEEVLEGRRGLRRLDEEDHGKIKAYCMILQTIIKIKKEGFGRRTING